MSKKAPKRLAVFCDGTWNDLRTAQLTNVARLAKCIAPMDGEIRQLVFYDEGVGVSSSISVATDKLVEIAGGAFGRGLDRKIEAAYRFIVLNYEPDDEIYIFGFSRGSYTARSLCGLIRKCGIVRRDCFERVPAAMRLYRDRKLHPKAAEVAAFREEFSHRRSAGPEDAGWVGRRIADKKPESLSGTTERARLYQYRPDMAYRIMYLGVWDTVGSLGVPSRYWFLSFLNNKYRFHDTRVSSLVTSVRHAVSIEEDRRVFDSCGMGNIAELNAEWSQKTKEDGGAGWEVIDPSAPNFVPYNHRPYQQVWFPGGHGGVGGGNPALGLPSATLLWMAEGAAWAGLKFIDDARSELSQAVEKVNPWADWRVNKQGKPQSKSAFNFLGWIGGYGMRAGPATAEEVGMPAKLRWAGRKWPRNLRVMRQQTGAPSAVAQAPKGFPPPPPGGPAMPLCYPRDPAAQPTTEIVVVGDAPQPVES